MFRCIAIFAALFALVYSSPVRDVELDFLERQAVEPTAVAPASPQAPTTVTVPAPSESPKPSPSTTTTMTATPSTTTTPSATVTPSTTSTASPTPSTTMTPTPSMSMTPSMSPSASVTTSPGSSKTSTPSATPTISTTPSATMTPSASPTVSVSSSVSPSASVSGIPSATPSASSPPLAVGLGLQETPIPASTATPRPPCFPASATVQLEDGSSKKMGDLSVGDRVAVGGGKYSEVFMFTHKLADVKQDFVQIVTEAGPALRLTAGHYLPVNGRYQPAKDAIVGDLVELATGQSTRIFSISTVQDTGLFNPQTTHGDVVVDGVLCSTYTTAVPRGLAHAALAPLRAVCQRLGLYFSFLESGADNVARFTSTLA